MCGIIGIASNKPVTENIIQSLKKLEYRGYDSAGIATVIDNYIDENKTAINVVTAAAASTVVLSVPALIFRGGVAAPVLPPLSGATPTRKHRDARKK